MQAQEQQHDNRGRMVRSDRQMSDQDTRDYLREHCVAHVGSSDASGWPYVVPLMYVYEEGNLLHVHTGPHQGHFLANVRENPRICVQLDESGPWHRNQPTPFDSSLVYKSVIVFGSCRVMQDPGLRAKKEWFFDQLLARLKDSPSNYEKSYPPIIDRIHLYEVEMEIVTGKRNVVLGH